MATYEEDLALPPELLAEQDAIRRRMAIAQALMQQGQEPLIAPQGGRYVVPVNPLQGLAKLAKTYIGAKGVRDSQNAERELKKQARADRQAEMDRILQAGSGTTEIAMPADALGGGPGRAAVPGGRDKLIQAMAQSQYPEFQQAALQQQMRPPIQLGRTLVDPNTYKPLAVDQAVAAEQEAARKQRMAELEMKLADARASRKEKLAAQKELASMQIESRKDLASVARQLTPAPTVTEIVKDGRIVKVDARTGREIGISPNDLETAANKKMVSGKEMMGLVDKAMGILRPSDKSKQLPTSSFVGAGLDFAGRTVGYEMPGAGEAAQLEVLAGLLTSKVPRMEGPQGVYDVKLYQQMAGQVGDKTLPLSTRVKALEEIKRIFGDKDFISIGADIPQQQAQSAPDKEAQGQNIIPESVKRFLNR